MAIAFGYQLAVQAQITPDDSLGNEGSIVVPDNINGIQSDRLEGGATRGSNLFHSFQDFNVDANRGAYFANPADISNIFSRITGANISQIDGTLGVLGNANLFLINPNGIVFGQNASLDLRGSFFASSADSLLFDDFAYSASNPQAPPLLEINIPIGLNFRDNSGAIASQSNSLSNSVPVGLQVDAGQSLTLVGGDINLTGVNLTAPGGKVELGAVATASTVTIGEDASLGFPENLVRGNVNFNNARIVVNPLVDGDAGKIEITAGAIALDELSILDASNSGVGGAGNILLQASGDISLTGSIISSNIGSQARGNAGEIVLEANSISLTEGSQLQSGFFTGGQGNGTKGKITIQANDGVVIDNSALFNDNQSNAIADSSDIEITARTISVSNKAVLNVDNFGVGDAGNVTLQAEDISLFNNVTVSSNIGSTGTGNVGNIKLLANSISLTENSSLQAGLFSGGQGNETTGSVSLEASNSIIIDSSNIQADNQAGTFADTVNVEILANSVTINNSSLFTSNDGVGNSGNFTIDAPDGAVSVANTFIFSDSTTGQSGDVNIKGRSLLVTDNSNLGGFATNNAGAGNVTIQTTDFATLDEGSDISVFSSGTGTGGSVTINSARLNILNGSGISAFVFGDLPGGNININTTDAVTVSGGSSLLLNTNGNGDAASLDLNTRNLTITGGSQISSSTFAGGTGGRLAIDVSDTIEIAGTTADGLTASRIDASTSGSGGGGDIQVNAKNLIVRDGSGISSFTTTGSSGQGGKIAVEVDDSIEISGFRPLGFFRSSIDTQTGGTGNAGKIDIYTGNLTIINGAEVNTSTTGEGLAGSLNILAKDSITLSGFIPGSGIGSQITSQSLLGGAAGDIAIATSNLLVRDAGQVAVSSLGTATAGNIEINADVIELDNLGILNAQTFGGEGNINLSSKDIFLRGESNITTNAFGSSAGGNIAIDTENLIAFPNENSDISANSENSFGGRVIVNAKGIFGTEFQEISTERSDITATSQLGAEFNGEVAINTPEVDPTSGLIELPQAVGDASDQISQNPCQQGVGSQFIVTGKGGLPPNPTETLESDRVTVDLVEPLSREGDEETKEQADLPGEDTVTEAVPAMGWVFNDKGEVTLTAYSNTNTERVESQQYRTACHNISP